MTKPTTRRTYLLAAIRAHGRPVTTALAEQLLNGTPWAAGRNTVRKGLRGLTRQGALHSADTAHGRIYHPATGQDGA